MLEQSFVDEALCVSLRDADLQLNAAVEPVSVKVRMIAIPPFNI